MDNRHFIRPYQPADLPDLYRICLLTADNGQDATGLFEEPNLPGEVFAAPYVRFESSLALVVQDDDGVGGYVLAALDSRAFAERLERDWWPALRVSYPQREPASYRSPMERLVIGDIHDPWPVDDDLVRRFPSHLHIDLLPRLQGRGLGRQLIEATATSLRVHGSSGLHLHVSQGNEQAARFYRHLGFSERPATDVRVFTMDFSGPAVQKSDPPLNG
jgi:ribosomal protein S18 acetylase RimI-like enzyme